MSTITIHDWQISRSMYNVSPDPYNYNSFRDTPPSLKESSQFALKDDQPTKLALFFNLNKEDIQLSSMGIKIKAFNDRIPLNINLCIKDNSKSVIDECFALNCVFENVNTEWKISLNELANENKFVELWNSDKTMTLCCKMKRSSFVYSKTKPDSLFREKLWMQYKQELETDITIKCGEQTFKVGRFILTSQSEYFERMFLSNMKESETKIIEINDVKARVMEAFIRWLYLGTIECEELAEELFVLGDRYMIEELKTHCVEFIAKTLTNENIARRFAFSLFHGNAILRDYIMDFIELSEMTDKWKTFSLNIWSEMSSNNNFETSMNESDGSIMSAKPNKENRNRRNRKKQHKDGSHVS